MRDSEPLLLVWNQTEAFSIMLLLFRLLSWLKSNVQHPVTYNKVLELFWVLGSLSLSLKLGLSPKMIESPAACSSADLKTSPNPTVFKRSLKFFFFTFSVCALLGSLRHR